MKIKHDVTILGLTLFLYLFSFDTPAQTIVSHPIKYVEAGYGFEDLEVLSSSLSSKRVVAVGEATHGTKEFFQMKHRIFEFLVQKHGFKVFAIEAGFGEMAAINEYVRNGKGNPHKLVNRNGFWTWDTQEVLDLVIWMRNYNIDKKEPDQISVYGFDFQGAGPVAKDLLSNLEDSKFPLSQGQREMLNIFITHGYRKLNEKEKNNLRKIFKRLRKDYEKLKRKDFSLEVKRHQLILHYFDLLGQYIKFSGKKFNGNYYRDRMMAKNIEWILNYEGNGSKTFIWAHNGHVGKRNYLTGRSMGKYLSKKFKEEYYALGLTFQKGSFIAINYKSRNLQEFYLEGNASNCLGTVLPHFSSTGLFIDFKTAGKDIKVKKHIQSNISTLSIGADYNPDFSYYGINDITSVFDGIIHFKEASSAKQLERLK